MDVDDPYEALPPYTAVIECVPAARAVVETDAVPPVDKVAEPMVVESVLSRNQIVPVAVVGLTVAVKVTDAPYADDAEDCTRLVVELALTTVCVRGADWEPGRFASPT